MRTNLRDKILLLILLLPIFGVAQINVNTNFGILSNQPIDTRDTLTTLADTANVAWPYPGLVSYVASIDEFWYYDGTKWGKLIQDLLATNVIFDPAGLFIDSTNVQGALEQLDGALNFDNLTSPYIPYWDGGSFQNSTSYLSGAILFLDTQLTYNTTTNQLIFYDTVATVPTTLDPITVYVDNPNQGIRIVDWSDPSTYYTEMRPWGLGINVEPNFGSAINAAADITLQGDREIEVPTGFLRITGITEHDPMYFTYFDRYQFTDQSQNNNYASISDLGIVFDPNRTLSWNTKAAYDIESKGTKAFGISAGTTAQQPLAGRAGALRYDTDQGAFTGDDGLSYRALAWADEVAGAASVFDRDSLAVIWTSSTNGGAYDLAGAMYAQQHGYGVDGNTRGGGAVDLQQVRSAATNVASGSLSVLVGGQNNTASGTWASSIGGRGNTSSGSHSFAGGDNSTASGSSAFAYGTNATSAATYSVAFGEANIASDNPYSFGFGQDHNSQFPAAISWGAIKEIGGTNRTLVTEAVAYSSTDSTNAVELEFNTGLGFSDYSVTGMYLVKLEVIATPGEDAGSFLNNDAYFFTRRYIVQNNGDIKGVISGQDSGSASMATATLTINGSGDIIFTPPAGATSANNFYVIGKFSATWINQ